MSNTHHQLRGTQLALWMVSEIASINFTLTARVRGAFTAQQLQRALEQLQRQYPPLAMRVEKESLGNVHLIPDASLKIPVRHVEQAQADSWIGEATAELVCGFDGTHEPPLRVVWLSGDSFSDLILVCPHTFADGLSTTYIARDLLTFLGQPDKVAEPMPMTPALSELIPNFPGQQPVIWQSKLKSAVFKFLLSLQSKKNDQLIDPTLINAQYSLLHWELTPEQTSALVTRSRAENTTVHAALCTALLRAFGEFYGNGWKRVIQSPISLRERLTAPVGEAFGLYINLAEFPVDCAPDHNFWEVARTIKKGFIKHTSDKAMFSPLVDMNIFMEALAPLVTIPMLLQSVAQVKYDLSITNLGALKFPTQFGALQLEALYGPCISGKRNEIILAVNTLNEKMNLTLTFTDQKLTPAQAEQIRDKSLKWLAEATGW